MNTTYSRVVRLLVAHSGRRWPIFSSCVEKYATCLSHLGQMSQEGGEKGLQKSTEIDPCECCSDRVSDLQKVA